MAKPAPYSGSTKLPNRRHTVYVSPRLSVAFEMNRKGIARIAVGKPLEVATRSVVTARALPYAVSISPRGETLDYVSSWKVKKSYVVIAGMRRVASRLLNTSRHAAAVEWVNKKGHGHGHRVLGRTLAHLNSVSPPHDQRGTRGGPRKPFDPQQHPRGPRGRFIPKGNADQIRRRARRASQIRNSE